MQGVVWVCGVGVCVVWMGVWCGWVWGYGVDMCGVWVVCGWMWYGYVVCVCVVLCGVCVVHVVCVCGVCVVCVLTYSIHQSHLLYSN